MRRNWKTKINLNVIEPGSSGRYEGPTTFSAEIGDSFQIVRCMVVCRPYAYPSRRMHCHQCKVKGELLFLKLY